MIGLGNHSDHILDLLFQAKGWPGGQKQHASLAPHTDIFHYNGTHFLAKIKLVEGKHHVSWIAHQQAPIPA